MGLKTILCYGDSNTYGLMPDLVHRYPRDIRWPGVLQSLLGPDYYVIEEGLGGRTTVWDDPIEEYKNGKKYLLPCLDSHKPIDLVALMLGTNDLKARFHVSSFDVAQSMENLVRCILKSDSGMEFTAPQVLLIPPVPLQNVGNLDLERMLEGGFQKSRELAEYYRDLARRLQIHYFDPAGQVWVSETDGIHYTPEGHARMAELVCEQILDIFNGVSEPRFERRELK